MEKVTQRSAASLSVDEVKNGASLIEKEQIVELKFPKTEVLNDEESKRERSRKIHRATSLGNLEKHKVMIVFSDTQGVKKVSTTIWAQTEKKIILKGGNSIPVHCIWDVVM